MTLKLQTIKKQNGFISHATLLAVLVILIIGLVGVLVWRHDDSKDTSHKSQTSQTSKPAQTTKKSTAQDPSENGKYLVIKEWHMRAALPENLIGKVTYSLEGPTADPDGNMLMLANIYIVPAADSTCPIRTDISGGYIDASTLIYRSEKSKPFNASRYRFNFKENIASDDAYNYHLNSAGAVCNGPETEALETTLRESLTSLAHYE